MMNPYFEAFGMHIPAYGLISIMVIAIYILCGLVVLYRCNLNIFDGCVLGAYGLLGAVIGSKLFLILLRGYAKSTTIIDKYVNLVQSGGMASGGILIGLCMVMLAGRIHKIDYKPYMNSVIFILPLCQGVWKIGCLCAGCCYGIPYNGIGSIIFPSDSHAITGIPLFPVQILEALLFWGVSAFFYLKKDKSKNIIAEYWLVFGIIRFLIEFLRNADTKHMFLFLSDTQWIDVFMISIALVILFKERVKIDEF